LAALMNNTSICFKLPFDCFWSCIDPFTPNLVYSTADWKFGAEQFDKLLSDKVIVHCKLSQFVSVVITSY